MRFLKENWGVILFLTLMAGMAAWPIVLAVRMNIDGDIEKTYCGPVITLGYDSPSSGHKSHTDAQYWVILRDEEIHQAIRVHVTPATYYDTKEGQRICFTISARDMEAYGNTNEWKHLK